MGVTIKDVAIGKNSKNLGLIQLGGIESSYAEGEEIAVSLFNPVDGGYFLYNNQKFDGRELRVSAADLNKITFVPRPNDRSIKPPALEISKKKVTTYNYAVELDPTVSINFSDQKTGNLNYIEREWQTTEIVKVQQDPFDNPKAEETGETESETIFLKTTDLITGITDNQSATWKTLPNFTPTLEAATTEFLYYQAGKKFNATQYLFTANDLDGDTIENYKLKDSNTKNSGYFILNGKKKREGKFFTVGKSELKNLYYVPGGSGQKEIISAKAFDGQAYGALLKTAVKTLDDRAPIAENTTLPLEFSKLKSGQKLPVDEFLAEAATFADPDNDKIESYTLKYSTDDGDGASYFSFNEKIIAEDTPFTVSANQLKNLYFVPGKPGSALMVSFGVTANGKASNMTEPSSWSVESNQKPSVDVIANLFAPDTDGKSLSISAYFKGSDPDMDPIKNITLSNASSDVSTGFFSYKGEPYQGKPLTVSYADLDKVTYVAGKKGSSEQITASVSDGWATSEIKSATWKTGDLVKDYKKNVNLSINKVWKGGDLIGIDNEKKFNLFLGPNLSWTNKSYSKRLESFGFGAGIDAGTGDGKLKAGLDFNGSYNLGNITLNGGIAPEFSFDALSGLKISKLPSINLDASLTLPSASLSLDAIADISLKPYLYAEGKIPFGSWKKSGNLAEFLNVDVNKKYNLFNISTGIDGKGSQKEIQLGSFKATAIVPEFKTPQAINTPSSVINNPTWAKGLGAGYTYGYTGSASLLDLKLSLSDIASYFGIPLKYSGSKAFGPANVNWEASLVDVLVGAKSDLNYQASVSLKTNAWLTVEGSEKKHEINPNLSIGMSDIKDLNNDGKISVRMECDPIIAGGASAKITSSLQAEVDALKAVAGIKAGRFERNWSIGPLYKSGPINIGNLGDISLFDVSKSWSLSGIAPDLQRQLVASFDIPLFA